MGVGSAGCICGAVPCIAVAGRHRGVGINRHPLDVGEAAPPRSRTIGSY